MALAVALSGGALCASAAAQEDAPPKQMDLLGQYNDVPTAGRAGLPPIGTNDLLLAGASTLVAAVLLAPAARLVAARLVGRAAGAHRTQPAVTPA
jgi:hypothetical protein